MADGAAKPDGCVRVGTWNVWWAKPSLKRAPLVAAILSAPDCDVLCVTEGDAGILPKDGHVIDAGTDWGYSIPKASPGRRKVLLWSKRPWTPVFDPLHAQLPGGRLVAGATETPIGKITVVGVCIPWSGAHVFTGGRNRLPWEDHRAWIVGFDWLYFGEGPTIVLGDFNQAFPRVRTPPLLNQALQDALQKRGLRVVTEGFLDPPTPAVGDVPGPSQVELSDAKPGDVSAQLIDHIAHSEDLDLHCAAGQREGVRRVGIFPRKDLDGASLSDHNGVWVDLKA